MFTIASDDLDEFLLGLERWHQEAALEAVQVYKGIAVSVFNYVTHETPQWTGSAAANWNLSIGVPDFNVDLSLKASQSTADRLMGVGALQKGDEAAIQRAATRNAGRAEAITSLRTPVYLANAAQDLQRQTYIRLLEDNPNNYLRPENEPGHMLANAYRDVSIETALISPAKAEKLSHLRLGDIYTG